MPSRARPTRTMLAAIGEVAAESAVVEQLMRDLFCHLIDSSYGQVILAGESMSSICQQCMRAAQYNLGLTDEQVEALGTITKTIELAYKERNYFVHARWEKVKGPGMHVGIRSSRSSPRENGSDTVESWICTPDDALEIATLFRTIADTVERFTEATFPDQHYGPVVRRAVNKRMEKMFAAIMNIVRDPDAEPTTPEDATI